MPSVRYHGKTVSDENIRRVLQRTADELGGDVHVTSGDRDSVPTGGSKTSHHLQHTAADFWVSGVTLAGAFAAIRLKADRIFDRTKAYQVIFHDTHTGTGGPHIHIGRYRSGAGVSFCTEGDTPATTNQYACTPRQ